MRDDFTCPKCGGNTNNYRHPYAKIWCTRCGFVLRNEGNREYNDVSSYSIKPPIGLMDKKFHEEERFTEVRRAITEYYNSGLEINIDWIKEYNESINKIIPKKPDPLKAVTRE